MFEIIIKLYNFKFRANSHSIVFFRVSIIKILWVFKGGEFFKTSPLDWKQWLTTIAIGAVGFIFGILGRFIPMTESPDDFHDNNINADGSVRDVKPKSMEIA